MTTVDLSSSPVLRKLVEGLRGALGDELVSVVLYGSAARGDYEASTSDLNVLIVVSDLTPRTLERLSGPVRRWGRSGQPMLRLLSPAIIRESADVFPIEFLDLQTSHRVLHDGDPFVTLEVQLNHLRGQCERELREKMMRLREAYFIRLQDELAGSENRITVERRRYNDAVRAYNTQVLRFPTNMVAGMFGFSDREYFEADEAAAQVPQVVFE